MSRTRQNQVRNIVLSSLRYFFSFLLLITIPITIFLSWLGYYDSNGNILLILVGIFLVSLELLGIITMIRTRNSHFPTPLNLFYIFLLGLAFFYPFVCSFFDWCGFFYFFLSAIFSSLFTFLLKAIFCLISPKKHKN